MLELNRIYNMDCMEGMQQIPNNYFQLAIVDPPYFNGPISAGYYGKEINNLNIRRIDYPKIEKWEVPGESYFKELFRVSKNQIIWGCNYYKYPFGSGRIVWDKVNGESSFSDCEIAYCSIHDSTRLFRYMWNGMLQGKSISEGHVMQGDKSKNEVRIHPTQKPVNLYLWQLMQYAKQGDRILDTHMGSGSLEVACIEMGYDYMGFDTDKQIFDMAQARIEGYTNQLKLGD